MTVRNTEVQFGVHEPDCSQRDATRALLGGMITAAERRDVVHHLTRCVMCREMYFAGTSASARRASPFGVISAFVVLVLGAGGLLYWRSANCPASALRRLADVTAQQPYRVIEARLAGGFAFKPYNRTSGDNASVRTAFAEVPEDAHTAGVLLLLNDRFDAAIETLEQAARNAESADLLANLAAARYERGVLNGRPLDLPHAFSAATRAIEITPAHAEARYTLALTLQTLNLREDASRAWREYLFVDGTSEWASEARRHLSKLENREVEITKNFMRTAAMTDLNALVRRAPSTVRMTAEDELLGDWSDAVGSGNLTNADAALRVTHAIGVALSAAGGDRTVFDAVQQIAAADNRMRALLADGYRAYAGARRAFEHRRDAAAREALVDAGDRLHRAQSPLAARAYVYAATVALYEGNSGEAIKLLDISAPLIRGHEEEWPVVAGQALWLRGQLNLARGFPHQAIEEYQAAREHFLHARERSNVSGVETMLAACFRYIGDVDAAWMHYLESLRFLDEAAPYNRRQIAFADAAKAATLAGHLRLAEVLTSRVAIRAEERKDHIFIAQSLYARARILTTREKFAEAADLLARAAAVLDANPPTASTTRLLSDIASARGEALLRGNPREALPFLHESLQRHRLHGAQFRLPEVHLLVAAAQKALGDQALAERELRAGIEEIERQRTRLRTDEERSTFTDTARRLYAGLIESLVARDATNEALRIVRGARMVGLTSPGSLISARAHSDLLVLPDDTASIEYYALPERLLIWTTIAGRTRFDAVPVSNLTPRIDRATERIRNCLRVVDCREEASDLFELLLRPAMEAVRGKDQLVIAPDGILHTVPFAALFDRSTGTFLIQQHTLRIALGDASRVVRSDYRSIFVAVAPDSSAQPRLTYATAEARRAAASFPVATIAENADATVDRVLRETPRHDVLHFAGHARWNERQPRFASLQLSPEGNRPHGSLYAHEMNDLRFATTKLVVLAGCDTARGRRTGVGLLSFARTFTAAGVPRVVGSLWPVDDAASAVLFADFYPQLARGATPERALTHAQRTFLSSQSDNGPARWAMFQVYSGYKSNGGSQ